MEVAPFKTVAADLHLMLAAIDATITPERHLEDLLVTIDQSKERLYKSLAKMVAPLPAKLLTLKILNLFLSKYHFLARSTSLLSSPYGIIVDPTNACQLACPGLSRPSEKFRFEPSRKFLLTAVRLKDGTNRDEPSGTR